MVKINRRQVLKYSGIALGSFVLGKILPDIRIPEIKPTSWYTEEQKSVLKNYNYATDSLKDLFEHTHQNRTESAALVYYGVTDNFVNVYGVAAENITRTLKIEPPLVLFLEPGSIPDETPPSWEVLRDIFTAERHSFPFSPYAYPNLILDSLSPQDSPLNTLDVYLPLKTEPVQKIRRKE